MTKSTKFKRLCAKYGVDANLVPEVLSFEDGCKLTGDDAKGLPIVKGIAKRHQKRLVSDFKLSIIAEALRDGWKPDYTNMSEPKYFSVFEVKADKERPSGFGLSCVGYVDWRTSSRVGVRLCFPNRDTAIFFGKHFIDLHTDHHLYP